MNAETDAPIGSPGRSLMTPEADRLLHVWRLLWRERRAIARMTLIATLLSGVYAFIMPQTFTSMVTILPPQSDDRGSGLAELLSGQSQLFDMSATLGFGGRPSDVFVDILKSRTVAESLIRDQKLESFFGLAPGASIGPALELLQNATTIESAKDGLVTVSVSLETPYFSSRAEVDRTKRIAADIANGYAAALDQENRRKMVSRAKNSRIYIEQQLASTRRDLDTAYARLVSFQRSSRLLSLDKQLESVIHTATELRSQFVKAQLELAIGRNEFKESSRVLLEAQDRVNAMRKQYDRVVGGGEENTSDGGLGLNTLPNIGRDLANMLREVKILEEVNVFLNRQYYKEKVQEARDLPTVQILDPAIPAYQRTSPRRAMWLIVSFVLALLVSATVALVRSGATGKKPAG